MYMLPIPLVIEEPQELEELLRADAPLTQEPEQEILSVDPATEQREDDAKQARLQSLLAADHRTSNLADHCTSNLAHWFSSMSQTPTSMGLLPTLTSTCLPPASTTSLTNQPHQSSSAHHTSIIR